MARDFLLSVSYYFGMLLRMSPQKHRLIKRVSFCGDQILSSYKEFYWSNMYFFYFCRGLHIYVHLIFFYFLKDRLCFVKHEFSIGSW